jgi:hypothetical protein
MSLFKPPKEKKLSFSHTEHGDGRGHIQIYGTNPTRVVTATHEHENYDEIVAAAKADDERVFELFSPTEMLNRLTSLSDRIAYKQGRLYVDGDEATGGIVDHILRSVKDKDPNTEAMAKFYENLLNNPSTHSVEQAWGWLESHNFTITKDGMVVGYKGVYADANGGYTSREEGEAWVNGEKVLGKIPYKNGDVITMPRSEVTADPAVGCSVGLHVGTWKYARNFSSDVFEVIFNPRDIVSVPTESNEEKVRVCRMEMVGICTEPHTDAVV